MMVYNQVIPPELELDFRKICSKAFWYRYNGPEQFYRLRQDLRRDDSAIKTRPIYKWPK
jgi:hypothetical protein